jgi:hypothetical protein
MPSWWDKAKDAVDEAKETVGDAVDEAQDTAEDVKEAAGDVAEGAQDVAEEAAEGDVGGAVDEAQDTAEDVASGDRDTGSSSPPPESSGSSGGGGGSRDEYDDVDEFDDSGGGSSSGSSDSGDVARREAVMPDEPATRNEPPEQGSGEGSSDPELTVVKKNELGQVTSRKEYDEAFRAPDPEGERSSAIEDYQVINPNAPESVQRQQRELQRQQDYISEAERTERTAEIQQGFIENRLDRLQENFEPGDTLTVGGEEVSYSDRVDTLRSQQSELEQTEQEISSFQEEASGTVQRMNENLSALQSGSDNLQLRSLDQDTVQVDGEDDLLTFSDAPTDSDLRNQFASGTNIPGGYTEGTVLSNPESRRAVVQQNRLWQTLGSPEGYDFIGNLLTGNEAAADDAVGEAVQRARSGENTIGSFLSSPLGTATTAVPIGKGAQVAITGASRLSSTAGTALRGAAIAGVGAYGGSQTVEASQELSAGQEGDALGTVLQTGAELGGIEAGARSAARSLSPRLGRTTVTESDAVLRSVSGSNTRVGTGSVEAETNLVTPSTLPWRTPSVQRLGASSDNVLLQQTDEGITASGRVDIEQPGDADSVRETFFGTSRPARVQSTDSDVTVSRNRFEVGGDDARFSVTRNIRESKTSASSYTSFGDQGSITVEGDFQVSEFSVAGAADDGTEILGSGRVAVDQGARAADDSVGAAGGSGGSAASGSGGGSVSVQESGDGSGGGEELSGLSEEFAQAFRQNIDTSADPDYFGSAGAASASRSAEVSQQEGSMSMASQDSRQEASRDVVGSRQENTGGVTVQTSGSQIASGDTGSLSGGAELNSRASEIVRNEKERFRSGTSTVSGSRSMTDQDLRPGSTQRPGQRNNAFTRERTGLESLSNNATDIIGSTQRPALVNPQMLGTRLAQRPVRSRAQITGLGLQTGAPARPVRAGLGAGFDVSASVTGAGFGSSGTGGRRLSDSLQTDWFSANLVEQVTGEKAVFDASKEPRNQLFGLKASQERTGSVEPDKILEDNNMEDGNIW